MNRLILNVRRAQVSHSRVVPWFRARVGPLRSVVGSPEQLTAAISSVLALPEDAARDLARRIIAAEAVVVSDLGRPRGAAGSGASPSFTRPIDLKPVLALEEQATPFVLALPFTTGTVKLLNDLSRRTQRVLRVELTPLVGPILRPLAHGIPDRMELHSPGELVRRNLPPRTPAAGRETFVTFPDHHWTGEETSRRVRFFHEDHWFALLESLLLIRGASPILTLAADKEAGGEGLVWAEYSAPATDRQALDQRATDRRAPDRPAANCPATAPRVTEWRAKEPLVWLAACLEATMRACPAEVLSWSRVAARSVRARESERLLDRNLAAGFIRAWRAADPAADRELLEDFLKRLEWMASPEGPASPEGVRR